MPEFGPGISTTVSLQKFAKARGGAGFPPHVQGKSAAEAAHPFFKVSDMNTPGNEVELRLANHYVTDQDLEIQGYKLFPAGTVIFAKVGAALLKDRKRILAQPSMMDNNLMGLSVTDPTICHPKYLYYWLQGFKLSRLSATGALP